MRTLTRQEYITAAPKRVEQTTYGNAARGDRTRGFGARCTGQRAEGMLL